MEYEVQHHYVEYQEPKTYRVPSFFWKRKRALGTEKSMGALDRVWGKRIETRELLGSDGNVLYLIVWWLHTVYFCQNSQLCPSKEWLLQCVIYASINLTFKKLAIHTL
jgi:hypothetical protein